MYIPPGTAVPLTPPSFPSVYPSSHMPSGGRMVNSTHTDCNQSDLQRTLSTFTHSYLPTIAA